MVNLLNRDPPGRLSCVHAFLQSVNSRFNSKSFTGEAAKHIVGGEHNPIEYCTCARNYSTGTALVVGERKYCPFLRSGSSKSYCYLVNSNEADTQKSKAVGLAVQALDALGLCTRSLNTLKRLETAKLTEAGVEISKHDFFDPEARTYYEREIVNYGPAVGFLHYVDVLSKGVELKHSTISKYVGRPSNNDKVVLKSGEEVPLNDGDAMDSRTRTSGALQAWLTYAGYVRPQHSYSDSYSDADNYYCNSGNKLGYSQIFLDRNKISRFFDTKPLIKRPLGYDFYIKGVGTAREYSQRSSSGVQLENQTLKEYGSKVRDRRFLLMYAFSLASAANKYLNLRILASLSNFEDSPFVVDADTHERVLVGTEAEFLNIAGAPFLRDSENFEIIKPRVTIETEKLLRERPFLTPVVEKIVAKKELFV